MCGILGAVLQNVSVSEPFKQCFHDALKLLQHRGPDASGIQQLGNICLGHTRLSILDLSDAGNQPMVNSDSSCGLTYNGEIYNYQELLSKYSISDLRSTSDTEVLFRLLQKFGSKIIPELNGMFAFAFTDRRTGNVIIARDRVGIKPLYYTKTSSGIYFASELKSLLHLVDDDHSVNSHALHEWTYYGVALGRKTLYRNVHKVLPGEILEISTSTLEVKTTQYWQPANNQTRISTGPGRLNRFNDLAKVTSEKLERAVTRQLVSDVPVGVFLSGGIDSSAIAAFACRNYKRKLSTYSVGFDFDKGVNELPVAREFAKKLGTDHHEIHIEGADLPSVIEKMIYHHDQPFSDAANIPLYLLCDRLRDQIKVVLQGDGGDELFGGYRRYNTLYKYRKAYLLARAFNCISPILRKTSTYFIYKRYANAVLEPDIANRMARLLTVENPDFPPTSIYKYPLRGTIESSDPFVRYRECQDHFKKENLAQQMLMVDFQIILPDVFLEKVDKSTMAASVESRVPFLDNELIDFCHSLSIKDKMPGGTQKGLLKKALEGVVSDNILYGPKHGFSVPYGYWLKTALSDFFHDHLSTFLCRNKNIIDENEIKRMYSDYKAGRRDNGFILWKVMNLIVWINLNEIQIGE